MAHRDGLLSDELVTACEERCLNSSNEKKHFGRTAQKTSMADDVSVCDEKQDDDVVVEESDNDCEEIKRGKGSKQPRDRKFSLSSYIRPERLEVLLRRSDWIQHWAYCTHDKDVLADGSLKEVHTHVILYTYNAKTSSAIRKIFDRYAVEICEEDEEPQNTLCQTCSDMVSAYRYLIHADQKNKAQYEPLQRVCDDYAYWQKLEESCGYNDVMYVHLNTIIWATMSGFNKIFIKSPCTIKKYLL